MSFLEVRNIEKRFKSVNALTGVSIDVSAGERVGLIGPNGSGKTTFFNTVSGVLRPDNGKVTFDGRDVTGWPTHRLARKGMVRTFQHASVFPELTVEESVTVALEMHRHRGASDDFYTVPSILSVCGLGDVRGAFGGLLAYGAARRLNLAVAMAARPSVLMLDEPAAGLNDAETEELRIALMQLNSRGIALVVIDHDMPFISNLCERAVVLASGSVLAEGTLSEIRDNHEVRTVYLGKALAD